MSHAALDAHALDALPLPALYARLAPITARARFVNWGQTFACTPLALFEPASAAECALVLALARREGRAVRAVGVGHSPSDLACTAGYMVRMTKMCRLLEVDTEKLCVTAEAGITLHDLHAALAAHGLAMSNVGSISDQTLAGIVTTATHGSGVAFGVMSTHVRALTLLLADGSCVACSRTEHPDLFMASICGLGSTGLILAIQLDVEPAFRLHETQYTTSFDDAVARLDAVAAAAEHVRLWWFPSADTVRVSSADRTYEAPRPAGSWLWHTFFGYHVVQLLLFLGRLFTGLNPLIGRFAAWLISTPTDGIDDSHRIFNVDCRYPQHTTEWAIPHTSAPACLRELRAWLAREHADPRGLRPHFPVEIRFSAADDIWLSPSSGRRTCWIGIVQYKPYGHNVPYQKLFRAFEATVARHGGRPHWAKAHALRPAALRVLYPRFDDFVRVLAAVDPRGMFRNAYVERHIFGNESPAVGPRVFKPPVPQ